MRREQAERGPLEGPRGVEPREPERVRALVQRLLVRDPHLAPRSDPRNTSRSANYQLNFSQLLNMNIIQRGGGHREREIEGGWREEERKRANREVEA